MAYALEDLASASLGRQFPETVADVADLVSITGPVQSQTARTPFIGLAARRPGTTHAEVTGAYADERLVRGSTIRGTVHTATPGQYAALSAATRVGQRTLWQRLLKLERGTLDDLWAATEEFAADWRTPQERQQHLHDWLMVNEERDLLERGSIGRYLRFGHGGLVRRLVQGSWSGQARRSTGPCVLPGRRPRWTPSLCTCGATVRPRGTTSRGGRASACESSTRRLTGWGSWEHPDLTIGSTSTYSTPRQVETCTGCDCCRSSTP